MAYNGIEDFVTKAVLNAIDKSDGATLDEHARLIGIVVAMGDRLTVEQVAAITDAIPYEGAVPEWHEPVTSDGLTMQDLGDGIAELSAVVSDQGDAIEMTDDALAELSEIVSGLVPNE
jgi:hypothetical protein